MGYSLQGSDGRTGRVVDLYYDATVRAIRYLLVQTGRWLSGRLVAISPSTAALPDDRARSLPVRLTRQQVADRCSSEEVSSILRGRQVAVHDLVGLPVYWCAGFCGPVTLLTESEDPQGRLGDSTIGPDLQSISESLRYRIQAMDGQIGHAEEFVLDDQNWTIRYTVVGTRNWFFGKRLLACPAKIGMITRREAEITIAMSREQIEESPVFSRATLADTASQESLKPRYGCPRRRT